MNKELTVRQRVGFDLLTGVGTISAPNVVTKQNFLISVSSTKDVRAEWGH